jgi:DNA (cytosine-5)-methyltransferase 1
MLKPRLLDLYCGAGGASMGYHLAGFDVEGVDIAKQPHYPFVFHQADAVTFLRENAHRFDAFAASPPCQAHSVLRSLHKHKVYLDLIPETREALRATGKLYVIENVMGAPLRDAVMLCGTMFGLRTSCGAELRRHRLFETNWFVGLMPRCQHYSGVISIHGDHPRDRSIRQYERVTEDGHERYPTISVIGSHARGGPSGPTPNSKGKLARRSLTVTGHTCVDNRGRGRTVSVTGSTPQQNVERNKIRETFPVSAAREAMGIDWMVMKDLSQAIPPAYTEFLGRRLLEVL